MLMARKRTLNERGWEEDTEEMTAGGRRGNYMR